MDREDWGSLAAFAVVAEERSFTRAAARLGVSPSALSHTMRRLEERLNVQLLARSTRSVSTTQAGERLLARLSPAIGEIASAVEQLGAISGRPSGHIRISAPGEAARRVIAPALPKFVAAYPHIVVEVLIEQAFTNIVERRLDAGIRLGESLEKDVVAVPVSGLLRMAVIASPAYLQQHGVPKTPRDLRSHRCINIRLPSAGTLYKWEFERGTAKMDIAVEGPLIFDAGDMVVDAAVAGVGIGYVLEDRVLNELKSGALVRVPRGLVPALSRLLSLLPGPPSGIAGPRRAHRCAARAKPTEKAPLNHRRGFAARTAMSLRALGRMDPGASRDAGVDRAARSTIRSRCRRGRIARSIAEFHSIAHAHRWG